MKFKIAICDDEQNQIDYIASIVASWSAHAGHNCEIRTFASAEAFLFEYEDDKAFGILLLDIEMENIIIAHVAICYTTIRKNTKHRCLSVGLLIYEVILLNK